MIAMSPQKRSVLRAAALLFGMLGAGPAAAQQPIDIDIDIEIPSVVLEEERKGSEDDAEELNLANIVLTAAKGVTTVQEAPLIVTVLTGDEIHDRGFTDIMAVADSVPGWLQGADLYNMFPQLSTRGHSTAAIYLINSVQMYDPFYNIPTLNRVFPLETIKRVETITGPGGVLWGANSFMGLFNIITKDADDVDGVEAGVRMGGGPGDRGVFRGYVMAGVSDLPLDSKVFIHGSYESYRGPVKDAGMLFWTNPPSNPFAPRYYGPRLSSNQARSDIFNLTGKVEVGDKFNISFSAPFVDRVTALSIVGFTSREDQISDQLDACQPDTIADPTMVPGQCADPFRRNRQNEVDWYDRYAAAEYRTRFADGKAGVTARTYFSQFVRDFPSFLIAAPEKSAIGFEGLTGGTALLPDGGVTSFDGTNYRAGMNVDSDVELPGNIRLLLGAEAFYEWYPGGATAGGSIGGEGILATFLAPLPNQNIQPCPADPTDAYDPLNPTAAGGVVYRENCPLTHVFGGSHRTVMGAYANPQWKLARKLTLDGGLRLQGAPEASDLSTVGYAAQFLFSGALVYNFARNWFFKANYAEGIRPPVFNNLFSSSEAIQFQGDINIKTEESQAIQFEVNARLLRGVRQIRELTFRADYSYTYLKNLQRVFLGQYRNLEDRGIHAADVLAKLYLEGGHRIEAGYSYVRVDTEDRGSLRNMPNNWFNISGVFNVIDSKVQMATRMRVIGAFEDPNNLAEFRDYRMDEYSDPSSASFGRVINSRNDTVGCTLLTPDGCLVVMPTDLVSDRIPPTAELTAGVAYTPIPKLELSAWVHNAFNGRSYQWDTEYDTSGGTLTNLPYQNSDIRAVLNAVYKY